MPTERPRRAASKRRHYFAFGSNMDEDNLRARVGDVQFVGVGYLDDHRLVFNRLGTRRPGGVSSVEPRKGARVYGAVWRLDDTQLATLDEIENPAAYQRKMADITLAESGADVSCNIYVAFPAGVYPADQPYLELLIGAAKRLGFPPSYIRRLKTFRTKVAKRR